MIAELDCVALTATCRSMDSRRVAAVVSLTTIIQKVRVTIKELLQGRDIDFSFHLGG